MIRRKILGAIAVGALLGAPAYSEARGTGKTQQSTKAETTFNDAQIAAIVVAANDIDIENGKLARDKTENSAVKAFAERMVTDHESVNGQVENLAGKLDLKPEESDTSKGLQTTADQTQERLDKLEGAQFDSEYIQNEIAFHQQVIDTVDKALLPNAKNQELKALIQQVRPTLQAHLEHAKRVQGQLRPS